MGAPRLQSRKSDGVDRAKIAHWAEAHDIELIFLDPPETFDRAIVGVIYGYGQEPAVLYDRDKVIAALMTGGSMTVEEADEYFDFNTIGAHLGDATPRFLMPRAEWDADA